MAPPDPAMAAVAPVVSLLRARQVRLRNRWAGGRTLLAITCLAGLSVTSCELVSTPCHETDLTCGPWSWLGRIAFASARVCSLDRLGILQPGEAGAVLAELQRQGAMGSSGTPTFQQFGTNPGGETYIGAVLAPNGKIYGIPYDSPSVVVIDPDTLTITRFGSLGAAAGKFAGGVLAPNGKIYAIPYNAATVLEIDPETNTVSQFGSFNAGGGKWAGGVLAPNGKIYGTQGFDGTFLVIDPQAREAYRVTGLPVAQIFEGAVLTPTGRIVWFPANVGPTPHFGILDPFAETVTGFGATTAGETYFTGMLGPGGNILGLPAGGTKHVDIDPYALTVTKFDSAGGGTSWVGGALAANGLIYGIPYTTTTVLQVDPKNRISTSVGTLGANGSYQGGALALNGKIYGVPLGATTFLEIDPKANGSLCPALALSGYLNKF